MLSKIQVQWNATRLVLGAMHIQYYMLNGSPAAFTEADKGKTVEIHNDKVTMYDKEYAQHKTEALNTVACTRSLHIYAAMHAVMHATQYAVILAPYIAHIGRIHDGTVMANSNHKFTRLTD